MALTSPPSWAPASVQPTSVAFPKQPISRCGVISAPMSVDSEMSDQSTSPPPISLLSLLRRPSDTPSSPPTDAAKPTPQPILRRDSIGSDAETCLSLHGFTATSSKDQHEPRKALKFAVAAPHEPAQPHLPIRAPSPLTSAQASDEEDSSDGGYQEDEEDGEFSDDEDFAATIPRAPSPSTGKFPFARPTNYDYGRRRSSDFPPAPAVLPPPPRRGRGHIRVVDDNAAPKTCSRHCSPPPARSRSGSEARSRVSDAGPRDGRAGSPMPDVSDLPDVDDEAVDVEDGSGPEAVPVPRWRRASEHQPGFRRFDDEARRESAELCPPKLNDETIVGSLSNQSDSVYHRLESNLASSPLTRARSMGAKVSFAPRVRPVEAMSADELRE